MGVRRSGKARALLLISLSHHLGHQAHVIDTTDHSKGDRYRPLPSSKWQRTAGSLPKHKVTNQPIRLAATLHDDYNQDSLGSPEYACSVVSLTQSTERQRWWASREASGLVISSSLPPPHLSPKVHAFFFNLPSPLLHSIYFRGIIIIIIVACIVLHLMHSCLVVIECGENTLLRRC